ncbi:hypothetical protein GCM10023187_23730 [Nibrella viscosa]|uniref:Signal transduction histidine kinase internal region domain-containing protein n=1 Tax=Nibrella viscosa TaxID=1084524 RepID=A0ABP8KFL2_9BACT
MAVNSKTYLILLLALCLNRGSLWAQQSRLPFEFNHIQEQQGLSFNQISCFFQDRDGYFWVGTMNGLNRFDGSSFTVFKHNPADSTSIGHNSVYGICQDQAGHIWLGTGKGISRFDQKTGRFQNFKRVHGQLLEECLNILCDRSGDLWFSGRARGLYRYQIKTNRFTSFQAEPDRPGALASNYISIVGLVEDPHRSGIWMTTLDQGVHYYDKPTGRFHNARYNPEKLPIFNTHFTSSLSLDRQGRIMYADNHDERIVLFDTQSRTIADTIGLHTPAGTSPFPIAALLMDRSGNLWISSRNRALYYRDAATRQTTELAYREDQKTSPADKFFLAAWQHPDGSVWLGTTNGISYTNPEKAFYRIHNIGALLPGINANRGINCIVKDEDGSWWLSTASQELLHYFPGTAQLQMYQNLINHLNPHFLFNSLTSLNSLIITEPKQASRFLQKLSAIYRYILQNKEKETVSLEHELTFVNHYIDLQKSRFDDGLQIRLEVPAAYLSRGIVPVTLQNLFENAIKHNVIDDENPLIIRVYVDADYLCVANTLQRKHFVGTSNQQGLDSLKSLYSYLSDQPVVITDDESQFVVKLPLL